MTASPAGIWTCGYLLMTLVRLNSADSVEQALADMDEPERQTAQMRTVDAALKLARGDLRAATATLAPVLNGPTSSLHPVWRVQAFLLEATARDALGDTDAATRALVRALDLTEPDGVLLPFLLHPATLAAPQPCSSATPRTTPPTRH